MKRVIGRLSLWLLGACVFVVALGLGFLIHLRLGVVRGLLVKQVDGVLAETFAGKLRIDRVESIGLRGLRANRVEVDDPDGVRVLTATNVHVTLSALDLARAEIFGDKIVIDRIDVDDGSVLVGDRLARAFAPRHPSATNEPSKLALSITDISLVHVWVHGLAGKQPIDADVDHAEGSLDVVPSALEIDLRGAGITARGMPRNANPRGHVAGRFENALEPHAVMAFLGHVGALPVRANGRVDGEAFIARATVPETTPQSVRSIAPEVPLFEDVSLDAETQGRSTSLVFRAHGNVGPGAVDASGRVDHGAVGARAFARHVDLRAFSQSVGKSDLAADALVDVRDGVTRARGHVDAPGGHAVAQAIFDEHVLDVETTGSLWNVRSALAPVLRGTRIDGHGAFHARAHLDRDANAIASTAWARFENVATGDVSAGVMQVDARANGAIADPAVDANVYVERTVVPHVSVKTGRVHASGRLHDANVTARITANGPFDLSARVRSSGDAVAVDDLDVRSDGRPILRGDVDYARDRVHAKLTGRSIDLAQVKNTLGVDVPLGGTLHLDVDATATRRDVNGYVMLDARKVSWDRYHDVDARIEASALSGQFSVIARAAMPDVGWLAVESMDLRPSDSPLELASWKRATGSVHVDASANVAEAIHLVNPDETPATGWARVALVARRQNPDAKPDVTLDVTTQRLTVTDRAYDLDLTAHVHVDPDGTLDMHASTGRGSETLALGGTTKLDWDQLLAGKQPDLQSLPFTADVSFPMHDAASLCHQLGFGCRGQIGLTAHVDGPVDHARATLGARLVQFRSGLSPFDGPIDASIDGTFDRNAGNAILRVHQRGSTSSALEAKLDVHMPSGFSSLYGSLEAKLDDLAVRAPPFFIDDKMTARMTGTATVSNIRRDARVHVDLDASQIDIGGVKDEHGKITGSYDGQKLVLGARLLGGDSTIDVRADASAKWGAALVPSIDTTSPATVAVRAGSFRIRALAPFVPSALGDVDGRLDADASGTIAFAPARVAFKGWAKVSDGKVESAMFGDMHEITAKLVTQPDGSFTLENAHFRGTTGLVNVTGSAHATRGLVDDVKIGATIDRRDPFPLVVSGQAMGDAWGRVDVDVKPRNEGFAVAVDVPSLHVTLPEQAHRALQELGAAKDVTIGVRDRRGEMLPVALAPPQKQKHNALPVTIAVNLGSDVEIVRGDMLRMTVTGRPVVHIGDETTMTGTIRLVRGTLDVEGKRFTIERGFVTFVSDPSNPNLDVVAGWNAPDGSHVTAQYLGAIKDGRLVLSSDPPHTQDEIVALLVFGSANGPTPSTGASGGNLAAKAISTGASFATQPFNKALEQLTHVDIKVRVDTSGSAAKSEVEVQIAKNISAQVAYVLGIPPPGTDPDLTWLTLAWHATAHWSFDFTIGDHGSTIVDSLWRLRY